MNESIARQLVKALPGATSEAERVEELARALTKDLGKIDGRLVDIEADTSQQVHVGQGLRN